MAVLLPFPDLTDLTRAELEARLERLVYAVSHQYGGVRQACVAYGIPVVLR